MGRAFEYRRASKEKRWDKMSKLFPKLAKNITIAAKEGGTDPDLNAKLRTAILNAKGQNMPKDNIEKKKKRAAGKDSENFSEVFYEGKGPHGVLVFVECATDNNTRTVANIKSYFNKYGGGTVPTGSLEFMFSRKAVFELELSEDKGIDDIELELIESGLEEIEQNDESLFIYGDYTNFGALSLAIEQLGLKVKKASLQRIALNQVEVTEEQLADIEKLIDKIEDDDDVQAVYTNIA